MKTIRIDEYVSPGKQRVRNIPAVIASGQLRIDGSIGQFEKGGTFRIAQGEEFKLTKTPECVGNVWLIPLPAKSEPEKKAPAKKG